MQIHFPKIKFRSEIFSKIYVLFFTFCLSVCIKESQQGNYPNPYALSPVYLEYLEKGETQIYNSLKKRNLEEIASRYQPIVQRYLKEYEESLQQIKNASTENDIESNESAKLSSNPILSFLMINRFVKYFRDANTLAPFIKDSFEIKAIPNKNEVKDAMDALLRLQHFYDLTAQNLSNGILYRSSTNARLSAQECFQLGEFAQENEYFTLALEWFDVTLNKLQNDKRDSTAFINDLKKEEVLDAIKETIDVHNEDYEESIQYGDMYSFSEPIQALNYSQIAHLSLRKQLTKKLTGKFYDINHPKYYQAVEVNMMVLCDGKNLQSPKIKSKLKCLLDTSRHPYWTINPLRIEILSESPKIIQIYNIFSDKWTSYLKRLSYSNLQNAPRAPGATQRTASYAWFDDTAIPEMPISKIIEFSTGLNVVGWPASDMLQVAAYAPGSHVSSHWDSFSDGIEEKVPESYAKMGNRLSTFLVYLNKVEMGGQTVFPLAGVSVKPIENSAVFWYSSLRNGKLDKMTLHAACPVIKGEKWIATKWTHSKANIFKRPCSLNSQE